MTLMMGFIFSIIQWACTYDRHHQLNFTVNLYRTVYRIYVSKHKHTFILLLPLGLTYSVKLTTFFLFPAGPNLFYDDSCK